MKKIQALLTATIAIAMILISCSEDSSGPSNGDGDNYNYFPTEIGSSWTYKYFEIDSTEQRISDSDYERIYLITEETEKDGQSCYEFDIRISQDVSLETPEYYYKDGGKIFTYANLLPEVDLSLPLDIPIDWYKIADPDQDEWGVHTEQLEDLEFNMMGLDLTFNGKLTITGKNQGIETVNYGENEELSVEARKFALNYQLTGKVKWTFLEQPIDTANIQHIKWFADGIGVVKSKLTPFAIRVALGNDTHEQPFNGIVGVLKEYSLPE